MSQQQCQFLGADRVREARPSFSLFLSLFLIFFFVSARPQQFPDPQVNRRLDINQRPMDINGGSGGSGEGVNVLPERSFNYSVRVSSRKTMKRWTG